MQKQNDIQSNKFPRCMLKYKCKIFNVNNLYLPSAVIIAQVLVGPSIKLHKEIIYIENNMVKKIPLTRSRPTGYIYKRGREVELRAAAENHLAYGQSWTCSTGTSGFQVLLLKAISRAAL